MKTAIARTHIIEAIKLKFFPLSNIRTALPRIAGQ
jgi:hypothetical protein